MNKLTRYGPIPRGVKKHLVCLTNSAEIDLHLVTDYMEISNSEAIRQGLSLMVTHVIEIREKRSKGLAILDANANAQIKRGKRKGRRGK